MKTHLIIKSLAELPANQFSGVGGKPLVAHHPTWQVVPIPRRPADHFPPASYDRSPTVRAEFGRPADDSANDSRPWPHGGLNE